MGRPFPLAPPQHPHCAIYDRAEGPRYLDRVPGQAEAG